MYFSYTAMPGIKQLSLRERTVLYRDASKQAKSGAKYLLLVVVTIVIGILIAGFLAKLGLRDGLLGYLTLGVMLTVWVLGYLYILNKHIFPEIVKLSASE